MLSLFQSNPHEAHLRRVATLLREAHMARIEHQAAAEHHEALADMYAQRAQRLERELRAAQFGHSIDSVASSAPLMDDKAAALYALDGGRRADALNVR